MPKYPWLLSLWICVGSFPLQTRYFRKCSPQKAPRDSGSLCEGPWLRCLSEEQNYQTLQVCSQSLLQNQTFQMMKRHFILRFWSMHLLYLPWSPVLYLRFISKCHDLVCPLSRWGCKIGQNGPLPPPCLTSPSVKWINSQNSIPINR